MPCLRDDGKVDDAAEMLPLVVALLVELGGAVHFPHHAGQRRLELAERCAVECGVEVLDLLMLGHEIRHDEFLLRDVGDLVEEPE